MTLRFSEAHSTTVYSKASADEIGRVIRYVVDATGHRVAALHVAGRKQNARLADWRDVVGFGPDAVVVSDEERLRAVEGDFEERVVRGDLELRGRRVLTDRGYEIGALTDVLFDEKSGEIITVETDLIAVSGDGLMTIGPYAVIVRHDAVEADGAVDDIETADATASAEETAPAPAAEAEPAEADQAS